MRQRGFWRSGCERAHEDAAKKILGAKNSRQAKKFCTLDCCHFALQRGMVLESDAQCMPTVVGMCVSALQ